MAFRKRNIALTRSDPSDSHTPSSPPNTPSLAQNPISSSPGTRPSPIDGRSTTSTGTSSLDAILAGHAGLPLGNSLLIGETGTTDYAGALLKFYAAEGVVQGHKVHVLGFGETWGRELPGLSEKDGEGRRQKGTEGGDKMKIAWRYEGLGGVRGLGGEREGIRGTPGSNKTPGEAVGKEQEEPSIFCHTFDLAKRLALPVGASSINYISIPRISTSASPFPPILQNLQQQLSSTPLHTIHRLVIPSLLSPALYPSSTSLPQHILQFLHGLRALLRQYPTRFTAVITFPLSLYPRSTGLVRWVEHLSDGVFELSPFPYNHAQVLSTSAASTKEEERPQGMFAVHKLPVWSEKGGGGGMGGTDGIGEDLAFVLSRRRFKIVRFSLPPVEGDREAQEEAQRAGSGTGMPKKEDLEF